MVFSTTTYQSWCLTAVLYYCWVYVTLHNPYFSTDLLQILHSKCEWVSHYCDSVHSHRNESKTTRGELALYSLCHRDAGHSRPTLMCSVHGTIINMEMGRRRLNISCGQKYADRCPWFSTGFGCLAPPVWNDLPLDTRLSPTADTFKRRLKTVLFA